MDNIMYSQFTVRKEPRSHYAKVTGSRTTQYKIFIADSREDYPHIVGLMVNRIADNGEQVWKTYCNRRRGIGFNYLDAPEFATMGEALADLKAHYDEAFALWEKRDAFIKQSGPVAELDFKHDKAGDWFPTITVTLIPRGKVLESPATQHQLSIEQILGILEASDFDFIIGDFKGSVKWVIYRHADAFQLETFGGTCIARSAKKGEYSRNFIH